MKKNDIIILREADFGICKREIIRVKDMYNI